MFPSSRWKDTPSHCMWFYRQDLTIFQIFVEPCPLNIRHRSFFRRAICRRIQVSSLACKPRPSIALFPALVSICSRHAERKYLTFSQTAVSCHDRHHRCPACNGIGDQIRIFLPDVRMRLLKTRCFSSCEAVSDCDAFSWRFRRELIDHKHCIFTGRYFRMPAPWINLGKRLRTIIHIVNRFQILRSIKRLPAGKQDRSYYLPAGRFFFGFTAAFDADSSGASAFCSTRSGQRGAAEKGRSSTQSPPLIRAADSMIAPVRVFLYLIS